MNFSNISEYKNISKRFFVISDFAVLEMTDEKGNVVRRSRTFNVISNDGKAHTFTVIISKKIKDEENPVSYVKSGDSFRISYTKIAELPRHKKSVLPVHFFSGASIVWETFLTMENFIDNRDDGGISYHKISLFEPELLKQYNSRMLVFIKNNSYKTIGEVCGPDVGRLLQISKVNNVGRKTVRDLRDLLFEYVGGLP